MEKRLEAFFAAARGIRLTAGESLRLKDNLDRFVAKTPVRVRGEACHSADMNRSEIEFKASVEALRVTPEEDRAMENAIFAFVKAHPVRLKEGEEEERWMDFSWLLQPMRFMAVTASAVLLVGAGGVAYASASALPGDALYSVKVNVNEEIEGLLQWSPESRAQWRARRVARRLAEAQALAEVGQLDDVRANSIARLLERQMNDAQGGLKQLEDAGAGVAAVTLSAEAVRRSIAGLGL